MFLSFLNRNEKELFLELAHFVAHSDAHFAEEEKKWIDKFRKEMNMTDYSPQGKSLDQILDELDNSTIISKSSILLEILNLIMVDYEYKGEEQDVVQILRKRWNISDEQYKSIAFWIKDKAYILKMEEKRLA